jgi:hypothetical protein
MAIILTIFLAYLTHRFIEEPFRKKTTSPSLVFKTTGLITIASVLIGVSIMLTTTDKIDVTGINGAVSISQIKARPIIYEDGCHANYPQTISGLCEYGDLNSTKTIILYGDSHAAQWFPALNEIAKRAGYKLISLTKSACSSVDITRSDQGAFKMSRCKQWRLNSIKRIQQVKPDVLIMSSFQYFAQPAQFTDRNKWWDDGQRKLLKEVRNSSPQLIYITDTPHPMRDIPSCLANYSIAKCSATSRSENLSIAGFKVIDPNSWLCSQVCPAVKDGLVVYRDESHISVDISLALIPQLSQALRDQGINL